MAEKKIKYHSLRHEQAQLICSSEANDLWYGWYSAKCYLILSRVNIMLVNVQLLGHREHLVKRLPTLGYHGLTIITMML
jgi:hypothetical protein